MENIRPVSCVKLPNLMILCKQYFAYLVQVKSRPWKAFTFTYWQFFDRIDFAIVPCNNLLIYLPWKTQQIVPKLKNLIFVITEGSFFPNNSVAHGILGYFYCSVTSSILLFTLPKTVTNKNFVSLYTRMDSIFITEAGKQLKQQLKWGRVRQRKVFKFKKIFKSSINHAL